MAASSTDLLLPHIARMEGYIPGEQPAEGVQVLKLNTNENPYPPSPRVLQRLRDSADEGLRRYPDASAGGIRQRLSTLFELPVDRFVVGNGSDELLNILVRCFADATSRVAFATPSYPYYTKLIDLQAAQTVAIDFDDDYTLPVEELAAVDAAITFVPNPNSPSGTAVSSARLDELAQRVSGLLVIDEAYVDFSQHASMELLRRRDNVVIMRTLSKSFSLAGIRVGFCAASPQVAAALWKVKEHYNVNTLSQVAAEAALDDIAWMQDAAARIVATRAKLTTDLRDLGFHVWDSEANFVLARVPSPTTAGGLYEGLKEKGILVRYFGTNPRLSDCLRISIGTDEDMQRLVAEIRALM